jgi:hypothetical protein
MKQIAPSTSSYLLEAPLEILHRQSIEWLDEIAFWKDEVAFFYKLIGKAEDKKSPKLKTKDAVNVEKHLIRISAETLDELKSEAMLHEQFLAKRKGDVKSDEPAYRSRHRSLATKFHDFENEFKEMKKAIFHMVEEIPTVSKK